MADNGGSGRQGRWRTETVRGEPYQVGGRTLVPVARVVSLVRGRGTVGSKQVGGWMAVLVGVSPVAIVEQTPDGERSIPIVDSTSAALRSMAAGAAAMVLALALIRRIARRARARKQGSQPV